MMKYYVSLQFIFDWGYKGDKWQLLNPREGCAVMFRMMARLQKYSTLAGMLKQQNSLQMPIIQRL